MRLSYLAFFERPDDPAARVSTDEIARLRACFREIRGLARAHIYTPATASDACTDDGRPPFLGIQLYFEGIGELEAAVGPGSGLKALAENGGLPALESARATQQAMLNRPFAVSEPKAPGPTACSYVVHYPGPAENLNEWLGFYVANHPRLMAKLPGVREIEILSRIDWIDAMPWARVDHIQRNRILFDSPQALEDALHSPVRHEMRAEFEKFPPFSGGSFHYPMLTEVVRPA